MAILIGACLVKLEAFPRSRSRSGSKINKVRRRTGDVCVVEMDDGGGGKVRRAWFKKVELSDFGAAETWRSHVACPAETGQVVPCPMMLWCGDDPSARGCAAPTDKGGLTSSGKASLLFAHHTDKRSPSLILCLPRDDAVFPRLSSSCFSVLNIQPLLKDEPDHHPTS